MIYWTLFWSFLRLGAFSFGGGYAMITLIQQEMERQGWLTAAQFADIVAIAEMTPGPIAINSATYVGYKIGGVTGSAVATLGIVLPSFVLILLASRFLIRVQKHPLNQMVFYGLRPVIIGLIAIAALVIGRTALLTRPEATISELIGLLGQTPWLILSPVSVFIFGMTFFLDWKFKINPIILILLAGAISGLLLPVLA